MGELVAVFQRVSRRGDRVGCSPAPDHAMREVQYSMEATLQIVKGAKERRLRMSLQCRCQVQAGHRPVNLGQRQVGRAGGHASPDRPDVQVETFAMHTTFRRLLPCTKRENVHTIEASQDHTCAILVERKAEPPIGCAWEPQHAEGLLGYK